MVASSVHSYIGPGHVIGPPVRLHFRPVPARFASQCDQLQHVRNKISQLRLKEIIQSTKLKLIDYLTTFMTFNLKIYNFHEMFYFYLNKNQILLIKWIHCLSCLNEWDIVSVKKKTNLIKYFNTYVKP